MGDLYQKEGGKKPWQSKTLWINLILAILAFFPQFREFVTAEHIGTIFTVVNIVLRFVTKEKLTLT